MSGIHQRVINLPQGYQTIVGEGAYQLSGGEKQRIAIARALMKAPKVFLFDEPTSALDSDNERLVLSSMKALMGRHTILICTHNMRLLEDVDYIICVDGDYTHVLRRNDVSSEELTAMLDTTSDSSTSVAQV
jgi:ABC-type bacteriocin/lantibiotic exporter with double-glycine peptidase domain